MSLKWELLKNETVVEVCEGHTLTLTGWGRIVRGLNAMKKAGKGHVLVIGVDEKTFYFPFSEDLTETKVWNEVKRYAKN